MSKVKGSKSKSFRTAKQPKGPKGEFRITTTPVYIKKSAHQKLKILSALTGRRLFDVMEEAADMIIAKYKVKVKADTVK